MKSNLKSAAKSALLLVALASVSVAQAARPRAATPGEAKYFSLEEDLVVQDYVAADRSSANITLRKCTYRLTNIDKSGEYYTGADGCFQLVNWQGDGKSQDGMGGIWIPSSPKKQPRLYMVVGTPKETCRALGFLICRLSMLEEGRFKLMHGNVKPEAVARIKTVVGSP